MYTYAEEHGIENLLSMKSNKKTIKKKNFVINSNGKKSTKDKIYMILKGVVLLEIKNFDGNSFYSLTTSNQVFGFENLLLEKKEEIDYSVLALTDVICLEIDAEFFLDNLYLNPRLYHTIISDIISRYFLLAKSYQYSNQSPEIKLGNSLINIAKILKLQEKKSGEIVFPSYITQIFLSKYIKSSESNISKACLLLVEKKIISRNPISILNKEKLEKFIIETRKAGKKYEN